MIGDSIDIEEERPVPALARDDLFCLVEIEAVALEILSAKIGHVEIAADAGRLLEGARAQEGTVEWVEAKGLVTAVRKRGGQSALNAAGGDARDRSRETPIGSCREAGEHIIFREPAGAAIAFDDQLARLAVKRAEMILVSGRYVDARYGGDVEVRLVVQENDVGQLAGRHAVGNQRRLQALGDGRAGIKIAVRDQLVHRLDAGTGEF